MPLIHDPGIPKRIQRVHISPLGKHCAVTRGHVSDECGHLHGEVELRYDLRVALLQLNEVLLELVVAKQRVVIVRWIVDNSLRTGPTRCQPRGPLRA